MSSLNREMENCKYPYISVNGPSIAIDRGKKIEFLTRNVRKELAREVGNELDKTRHKGVEKIGYCKHFRKEDWLGNVPSGSVIPVIISLAEGGEDVVISCQARGCKFHKKQAERARKA